VPRTGQGTSTSEALHEADSERLSKVSGSVLVGRPSAHTVAGR
jgi:hypothetical protein